MRSSINVFIFKYSKVVSNINERNQDLKLLFVTFGVNLVAGLDF